MVDFECLIAILEGLEDEIDDQEAMEAIQEDIGTNQEKLKAKEEANRK
jgi:hypothetical protein